jgi:hypothetical protein
MITRILLTLVFVCHLLPASGVQARDAKPRKILLIAGATKEVDKVGHHDYLGGCRLMQELLNQVPGVEAALVEKDWPEDEAVFEGVDALFLYTDGAGKQAYLATPERVALIQSLVDRGTGLVSVHQAVEFSPAFAEQSMAWTGAVYNALSGRGHWDSRHQSFPEHPVTQGVTAWEINDGWLNRFKFAPDMKGITPLVWSGKEHTGSPEGGAADIVGWLYERPDGGRSFSFSGLDAHEAWERAGVTQLMLNGTLWCAGHPIPEGGVSFNADEAFIRSFLTPRTPPPPKPQKP